LIQSHERVISQKKKGGKATPEETSCNQRAFIRAHALLQNFGSRAASPAAAPVVASFILQLGLLNENFLLQEIRRPIASQFV
jgi:hypothetical protein